MITINNLTFGYGKKAVFENLSVEFREGAIYGLLGENGVGKTTLLKLICSLQGSCRKEGGNILVDGRDPLKREPSFLQDICFVPDEIPVPKGTVLNYAMSTGMFYPKFDAELFRKIASEFEVDVNSDFRKMSFGQQKKAHLAFAMALGTKYLLMDEPTNGLDIPSKAMFRSQIARLSTDERVIIISTHQVKDVENMIDPIIILDRDQVIINASVQEITDRLYFDYSGTACDNALYREANAAGTIQVLLNTEGRESKVNIEALFNAVHRNKELIKGIFSKGE